MLQWVWLERNQHFPGIQSPHMNVNWNWVLFCLMGTTCVTCCFDRCIWGIMDALLVELLWLPSPFHPEFGIRCILSRVCFKHSVILVWPWFVILNFHSLHPQKATNVCLHKICSNWVAESQHLPWLWQIILPDKLTTDIDLSEHRNQRAQNNSFVACVFGCKHFLCKGVFRCGHCCSQKGNCNVPKVGLLYWDFAPLDSPFDAHSQIEVHKELTFWTSKGGFHVIMGKTVAA